MLRILAAKNKNGQSVIEYALALALVTSAVVTVLTQSGQSLSTKYIAIDASVSGDTVGCVATDC